MKHIWIRNRLSHRLQGDIFAYSLPFYQQVILLKSRVQKDMSWRLTLDRIRVWCRSRVGGSLKPMRHAQSPSCTTAISRTSTLPLPFVSAPMNSPSPLNAPGSTNPTSSQSWPMVSCDSICSTQLNILSFTVPVAFSILSSRFTSLAPSFLGAALAACFSILAGHVIRSLILALETGIGCHAINAFIASSAWLLADLFVTTPVHVGSSLPFPLPPSTSSSSFETTIVVPFPPSTCFWDPWLLSWSSAFSIIPVV